MWEEREAVKVTAARFIPFFLFHSFSQLCYHTHCRVKCVRVNLVDKPGYLGGGKGGVVQRNQTRSGSESACKMTVN